VRDGNGNVVEKTIPLLKTFRVWNFSQIGWPEGCEPEALDSESLDVDPNEVYAEAERVFSAYCDREGLEVRYEGDRACYNIGLDRVQVPAAKRFRTAEGFQRVLAHELVHSTGAKQRLDRDLRNAFGTEDYAREELVAELGAAFLCSDLGVSNEGELDDNHAAYLLSWIKRLRDNKYEIFTAARLAREAAACIRGDVAAEGEEDDAEQVAA